MNKTKKGFLSGASILTIVASCFALLGSMLFFLVGSMFTESLMKEAYMEDPEYTYVETVDGYYFTYNEDGTEYTLTQDDIIMITQFAKGVCMVAGVINLATAVAKLVIAIRILAQSNKDKYAKGAVIALLVLSALNFNLIEVGLLITAMCVKNKIEQPKETKPEDINIDDIVLK